MAQQKLYAGAKLREVRTRIGMTQKDFAAKLGVSLPYLNQMENNNRPVSTTVVLALAQEFGLDVTELSTGDSERLVSDMREALADPVFSGDMPPWPTCAWPRPTRPRWPMHLSHCTAAIGRPTSGWPRWTKHWAAKMPARDQALGKRCAISFTIVTTT